MFILATVVSSLVETLHRLFGLREKGLALLLANFYERVIATRATDIRRGDADRRRFVELMTANRGPVGGIPMPAFLGKLLRADVAGGDNQFLSWIWGGRRLGSLNVTTFMERLGGSEYGASLAMQASRAGGLGAEWMLKDLAQKFDAYGAEASQYFESRARLLSVLAGFVLAFAVNVNAFVLFQTFMTRPDIAQSVIDSQDKLQAQVDALNAAVAKVEAPGTNGAAAQASQADAEALRAELQKTRETVEEARQQTTASVTTLQDLGVPIGWKSWPEFVAAMRSGTPIVGLLLGGLLVGLGAPFWYKVVQNLTAVRALVGGKESGKDSTATTASAPTVPAGPTQTPNTPIEAFHAALGATLAAGELYPPEEAVG
jgi:uncharacterized protein YukE